MTKPKNIFLKAASETRQAGARYLTSNAVCLRYNASESSVRRWTSDPRLDFPKPFQIAPNGVNFWDQAELDAYDKHRKEQAREHRQAKTPLTAASASEDAATPMVPTDPHLPDQHAPPRPVTRPPGAKRRPLVTGPGTVE